ncbi:unnamed protein product (macronuclear) [Paramecium tetraurelia]|uniref:Uncharacterized protein n=1 Tax=Paramecium tetraurelia TaxID=5888 RepID=A0DDY0_PARTE|nr:uncharacterized protein GSPATT00016089001 [Paramecium tetraurelia]CAK81247.1 unnamed protein product [Paramecium tetraurelia]|eukprot:XP_001448644.1 hypothetical protein (macronuclear) [Paramecium tetraurelia strain d4-2]
MIIENSISNKLQFIEETINFALFHLIAQGIKIDQTEVIWNNLNPNFVRTFKIKYFFEVQQHLKNGSLSFYKFNLMKSVNVSYYGQLLKQKQLQLKQQGRKTQFLLLNYLIYKERKVETLSSRQIKQNNATMNFLFQEQTLAFLEQCSPFLRFYRRRQQDERNLLVYETYILMIQTKQNGRNFFVKHRNYIKVELWNYKISGNHKYLVETTLCINELIGSSKVTKIFQKQLINKCNTNKSPGLYNLIDFNQNLIIPLFIIMLEDSNQVQLLLLVSLHLMQILKILNHFIIFLQMTLLVYTYKQFLVWLKY